MKWVGGCYEDKNYQIINHIIIDMNESACRLTVLTLTAAAIGVAAVLTHSLKPIFLMLPVLIIPKFITIAAAHGWMFLGQFTLTTFWFGLIDGIALQGIIEFFSEGCQGVMPLFQVYIIFLTLFHYFQFQMVNIFHHKQLHWKEFLICQDLKYFLALLLMLGQHFISKYIFDVEYKKGHCLVLFGLVVMVFGQSLRILALFTCKNNFTHDVSFQKVSTHYLVTKGVYSFFRHPAYTGYFYFTVGGQIFLGNIITSIVFFIVLVRYFRDRIKGEQSALLNFFAEYGKYRKNTWICIPFVEQIQKQA